MRQAEIHTTTFKGQWQRPQDDTKMTDRWPFKHAYESPEEYDSRMMELIDDERARSEEA